MKLNIKINNVQQIVDLKFNVKFDHGPIVCVTGKNGTGKTTLVKAIRNLTNSDTFAKTSSEDVFKEDSSIEYEIDDFTLIYSYEKSIETINCRIPVPMEYRTKIYVELPIPHGERFTFFQRISNLDADIRSAVVLKKFTKPDALIKFLHRIYDNKNFDNLVAVDIKGLTYYCRLTVGTRYLREDYFSSGEYFLINIYRRVSQGYRLIVIDEIDISLDAAAQVRLIESLREFGAANDVKFLLTTHSLAMMQTLKSQEIFHLEFEQLTGVAKIENVPYNYIKSILFGFKGWDKYILTEDDVLKEFLEYLIRTYCKGIYFSYKIIYIGGGSGTTDLMKRNSTEEFFSSANNVISVLDGDQRILRHAKNNSTFCIPFESLEKELLAHCLEGGLKGRVDCNALLNGDIERLRRYVPILRNTSASADSTRSSLSLKDRFWNLLRALRLTFRRKKERKTNVSSEGEFGDAGKKLLKQVIKKRIMSQHEVIQHLCKENEASVIEFSMELQRFLTIQPTTDASREVATLKAPTGAKAQS
ncbi:AAA family ATPase [Comamonas sp.]|uniref:AAA family ATPase n=1 Tax=Comamonas sp. TaxID=34028 RepID=UPI00289CD4C5|nr:AAA family ATPase [Comamonas sp.]